MLTRILLAPVLTSMLVLQACVQIADSDPSAVGSLEFETIVKAGFSGIQTSTNLVIKTETQWKTFWGQHSVTSDEQLPSVDFNKSMVLVAAMGQRRSGGYSIEIKEVVQKSDSLEAVLLKNGPAPGAMTIQAISAPVHIGKIPRSDLPVKFLTLSNSEEEDE